MKDIWVNQNETLAEAYRSGRVGSLGKARRLPMYGAVMGSLAPDRTKPSGNGRNGNGGGGEVTERLGCEKVTPSVHVRFSSSGVPRLIS